MKLRRIRNFASLAIVALGLPAQADPGGEAQARQMGAILDYVVADYRTAVGDHGVVDAEELKEQQGFLQEALGLAAELPAEERASLSPPIERALAAAQAARPPDQVIPEVRRALEDLERRHTLRRSPRERPSYARGQTLFTAGCAACHAEDGSGHTDVAAGLSTRPPDIRNPAQAGPLSPFRIFNAVSYGVPGTSMPSYQDAWSEGERWDVAFYLLALGHPDAGRTAPEVGLGHLAAASDDELRGELKQQGMAPTQQESALSNLRRVAPYSASAVTPLAACRKTVAEALRQYRQGLRSAARGTAIAAYLDEFEAHEASLRVRDGSLVVQLEGAFAELRAGIEASLPDGEIASRGARVEALLDKAEELKSRSGGGISFAAALAIALREGLESTLLVGALLALAMQSGKHGARRAVHSGWILALFAGCVTWWLSGALLAGGGQRREVVEGAVELLTALLLLGASHWLLAQAAAKRWMGFLGRHARAAGASAVGLAGLTFLAIFREAFEVVVFYRGLLLEAPGRGRAVLAGALAGLLALAAVVVAFQRLGRKLKPRPLLLGCGALLCGLAVVMVGEGIRALQEAGVVGLHSMEVPQLPSLGFFATAEGMTAQGLVVLALLASFAYASWAAKAHAPAA